MVAPEDGGELIEVYRSETESPIYLYWAPDGERIGFLTGGVGGDPLALRVAMASGGEVLVIDSGRPYYWAWSPDDQSIFAHVGGTAFANPGQARLTFLRLDETITQVGLGLEPGLFQAPAYSPDGQFLVFASALESGAQGLMLADPAGDVRTVLAEVPGAVAFAWAPVGNKVAYIASQEPDQILPGDLYFLDLADPDRPVQIQTQAHGVVSFSWAPDGQRVAYLVPVIYTPPDTEARSDASINEILLDLFVADSEDGSTQRLWTFRPSQEMLQIIPFFDQYQRSATIWSPDGNYLVVSALIASQGEGVFIVPSRDNLEPRFLVGGRLAFWSWK
jgi:TolB protein